MKARIHVTLKKGVLDPQGKAIQHSLASLGYENIHEVRVGKFFEIESREKISEKQLKEMAEKLLSNIVIEDYKIEINE